MAFGEYQRHDYGPNVDASKLNPPTVFRKGPPMEWIDVIEQEAGEQPTVDSQEKREIKKVIGTVAALVATTFVVGLIFKADNDASKQLARDHIEERARTLRAKSTNKERASDRTATNQDRSTIRF